MSHKCSLSLGFLLADFGQPGLLDPNADASRLFQPAHHNGKRKLGEAGNEAFTEKQARIGLGETNVENTERAD